MQGEGDQLVVPEELRSCHDGIRSLPERDLDVLGPDDDRHSALQVGLEGTHRGLHPAIPHLGIEDVGITQEPGYPGISGV
jgi:hypothetical protein